LKEKKKKRQEMAFLAFLARPPEQIQAPLLLSNCKKKTENLYLDFMMNHDGSMNDDI